MLKLINNPLNNKIIIGHGKTRKGTEKVERRTDSGFNLVSFFRVRPWLNNTVVTLWTGGKEPAC